MIPVVHHRPPDPRRLQPLDRAHDRFGYLARQKGGIPRVHAAPQTPHRRRRRMRMGRRDQHAVRRHSRRRRRHFFGRINQPAVHHTSVDHAKNQTRSPVIQNHGLGQQWINHTVRTALSKHAIHPHRKGRRSNVHRIHSRPQGRWRPTPTATARRQHRPLPTTARRKNRTSDRQQQQR